jgi:hypothetical protein
MSERWLGLPALEVSVKVASGTTASRLTGGRPNIGDWPDTAREAGFGLRDGDVGPLVVVRGGRGFESRRSARGTWRGSTRAVGVR